MLPWGVGGGERLDLGGGMGSFMGGRRGFSRGGTEGPGSRGGSMGPGVMTMSGSSVSGGASYTSSSLSLHEQENTYDI